MKWNLIHLEATVKDKSDKINIISSAISPSRFILPIYLFLPDKDQESREARNKEKRWYNKDTETKDNKK